MLMESQPGSPAEDRLDVPATEAAALVPLRPPAGLRQQCFDRVVWIGCEGHATGHAKLRKVSPVGSDQALFTIFAASRETSKWRWRRRARPLIHLPVTAHVNQENLLFPQLELQSDAVLQRDGDGVQARQPTLQRM